jgi:hypothetical protein
VSAHGWLGQVHGVGTAAEQQDLFAHGDLPGEVKSRDRERER